MIRNRSELMDKPLEIDLNGPDGNAFCLMGTAKHLAEQLGFDTRAIVEDMMSDDYEHLIEVFEQYFGDYVILYR
jgi:hypothetical protein